MKSLRGSELLLALALGLTQFPVNAQSVPTEIAFTRIIIGWTNYSTAFLATHDSASADFSTLAAGYTPRCDVQPAELGAVFIWNGPQNKQPDFAAYQFQVGVWSTLMALTNSPANGDVVNWSFAAPTGGSLTVPDTVTIGGRPAWLLRFAFPSPAITFSNHQTIWIGVMAHGDSSRAGDLYIPTSPFRGPSDVQASSLLIGGWTYVVVAGGSTIYDGQLALELRVALAGPPPRLRVQTAGDFLRITWPASAGCFRLERRGTLDSEWQTVAETPDRLGEELAVIVPRSAAQAFFRLTY